MYARFVPPAVDGLMTLGSTAFAAGSFPAPQPRDGRGIVQAAAAVRPVDRCMALQKQFDAAAKTHGKAARIKDATMLRNEAGKLCGGNDPDAGIAKMNQALHDIGVKPKD